MRHTLTTLLLALSPLLYAQDTLHTTPTPTAITRTTIVQPTKSDTLWLISASRYRLDVQLRTTLAATNFSYIYSSVAIYEQMLADCEAAKASILSRCQEQTTRNVTQLTSLSGQLSQATTTLSHTQGLLQIAQQSTINLQTTLTKARRRLWLERISYIVGGVVLGGTGVLLAQ